MKLTKEQRETYKRLIRLGDSKKVAFETVKKIKPLTEEEKKFYRFAYEG